MKFSRNTATLPDHSRQAKSEIRHQDSLHQNEHSEMPKTFYASEIEDKMVVMESN